MFVPSYYFTCLYDFVLAFIIRFEFKTSRRFKTELRRRDSDGLAPIDRNDYPQS